MITNNYVRKALLERKVTFGTWIQLDHPGIAEILANAGYDWIAADCEHTDIDVKGFTELTRGMYGRGQFLWPGFARMMFSLFVRCLMPELRV